MPSLRRASGFTLFELVIVIVVVGILVGLGIPSFKYVTVSNRISAEMNTLVGDLRYARSEAIKEGLPVTVCSSTDGTTCAASSTWNTGWIVFVDANSNQTFNTNNDTLLRVRAGFSTTGSTDTLTTSPTALTAFTFNREGYAATGNTAVVNMQLHAAPVVNTWTRCLQVTPVGALTVEMYGVGTPSCQ
jgi:type IV fimbrial biogenesis protein FimT